MPNNWKTYKLSELTELITKGTTPSTYGFGFTDDGINFIKSESTNYDGRLDESSFVKVSVEAHKKLKRSQLKENDILFSMAGAYLGKTGVVCKNHLPANTNQANGIIRVNKAIAIPKFVAHALRNPLLVNYVNASGGQSAQPNINLTDIGNLEIALPPLSEQKSIASILSTIDDKIENNTTINKTLEEMAMALYKHWFVDFGPFQDGEFVESELGRIPKGWEVKRLSECNELILGGTPSRKNESYWQNGTIGWLNSGKVNEFRIISPSEYITEEALKKSSTKVMKKGTTVLAITGATLGQISRIEKDFCANQSVIGILESDFFSNEYIYLWIHFAMEELMKLATGGAQQHVNKNNVGDLKILYPNSKIMNEFQTTVVEIFENISINMFENQTLTQLRDTLLPKLISGEVRLKEFRE